MNNGTTKRIKRRNMGILNFIFFNNSINITT